MTVPAGPDSLPAPFASGRDADVYALDADRVLRRNRRGGDVRAEAAIMRHVAGYGFPVPRVHAAHGADLVMERLAGFTMADAFRAGEMDFAVGAGMLATIGCTPCRLRPACPARRWCTSTCTRKTSSSRPGDRSSSIGGTRDSGPPDLDLALSALILAEVGTDHAMDVAPAARLLLRLFLDRVGAPPQRALESAVAMRRADPALSGAEVDRLGEAAALVRAT